MPVAVSVIICPGGNMARMSKVSGLGVLDLSSLIQRLLLLAVGGSVLVVDQQDRGQLHVWGGFAAWHPERQTPV